MTKSIRGRLTAAMTRRDFLAMSAAAGAGIYLSACGSSNTVSADGGTLSWLTWDDHYIPGQLEALADQTGLSASPTLIGDNAPTLFKVQSTGSQFAMVSADALWLPTYYEKGLTSAIDLDSIPVSKQLYSIARDYDVWKVGSGSERMGFPFGWSTKPIYYNPKYVSPVPDSLDALLSTKYREKIVLEGDISGVLAIGGLAIGAQEPFNMSTDEIDQAREYLEALKPNILKFANQASEINRALANESAWIGMGNLGADYEVRSISGVQLDFVIPSEGSYGFVDAEQSIEASDSVAAYAKWINAAYTDTWVAQNFLDHGRPLFNEAAYRLLVNQGHKERADRLLYNQPEKAFEQTLVGPAENQQAYSDAFNEIFGG